METRIRACTRRRTFAEPSICNVAAGDVRREVFGRIAFWLLAALASATLWAQETPETVSTRGSFNLDLSSRSFDAPLFEDEATDTNFRLFGSQTLGNGAILAIWGYDEIPTGNGIYGAEADRVPFGGGIARFSAGDFSPLRYLPKGKMLVLGLVTTKTPALESAEDLRRRIDSAARYVPMEQLAISPQCGFSSTVHGNEISVEAEAAKLRLIVDVARQVWGADAV